MICTITLSRGMLDLRPSCNTKSSMQALRENDIGLEKVRICYSPFSRTTHTARVATSVLNIPFEGPQCKVSFVLLRLLVKNPIHATHSPGSQVEKHGFYVLETGVASLYMDV